MELNNYKVGDAVEILIRNLQTNKDEWRDAEVLDKRMIHPQMNYERFKPYPIIIVRTTRTYCEATPIYSYIGNIPVFLDNNLRFYDKENDEGIIHENQIRLKQ